MAYLLIAGQILLYACLLGLFVWGLKSGVSFMVFSRRREELNQLDARISVLKMHLRGKIKRKQSKIADALRTDAEVMNRLRPNLTLISELDFSKPEHYQTLVWKLLEITNEITDHIRLKHKHLAIDAKEALADIATAVATSESERIRENCRLLVKYDKAHILIISEIIEATKEFRRKVDEFNQLAEFENSKKKITTKPEEIRIEHFEELHEMLLSAGNSDTATADFFAAKDAA